MRLHPLILQSRICGMRSVWGNLVSGSPHAHKILSSAVARFVKQHSSKTERVCLRHTCYLAPTIMVRKEGIPLLLAEVAAVPQVNQLSASTFHKALHVGVLELLAPLYFVSECWQHAVLVTLVAGLKVRSLIVRQLQPVPEVVNACPQFLLLLL